MFQFQFGLGGPIGSPFTIKDNLGPFGPLKITQDHFKKFQKGNFLGHPLCNMHCWGVTLDIGQDHIFCQLNPISFCLIVSCYQGPTGRVFHYGAGSGQLLKKKSRVGGGFGSGRGAEIFDRVFPGTLFTLGYFQTFEVFGEDQIFPVDPKCY